MAWSSTSKDARRARAAEGGDGKKKQFTVDVILSTVGRRPSSQDFGLEALGVEIDRGFVKVKPQRQTTVPGIYAIGDLAGQPMLAQKSVATRG